MSKILDKIMNELNTLPEEKQQKAYQFVLSLKTDQSYLRMDSDTKRLVEGYQLLAEEHLMLCETYGGNDEVLE